MQFPIHQNNAAGSARDSENLSRRDFFSWAKTGLAGTALMDLLLKQKPLRAATPASATQIGTHFPPRVKRVIHVCLIGGLSHLDSFDYKPALKKLHGKAMPTDKTPENLFRSSRAPAQKTISTSINGAKVAFGFRNYFQHIATQGG